MLTDTQKEQLMRRCMAFVEEAIAAKSPPFAALLCDGEGNVVAQARNSENDDHTAAAHAEIKLLFEAGRILRDKDLTGYVLVTNAHGCSMCMSAAVKAGIREFVVGAPSEGEMLPWITIDDIAAAVPFPLAFHRVLEGECRAQIARGREVLDEPIV